jgi:hypothetical protein
VTYDKSKSYLKNKIDLWEEKKSNNTCQKGLVLKKVTFAKKDVILVSYNLVKNINYWYNQ